MAKKSKSKSRRASKSGRGSIPDSGRASRIMAQNLLVGDEFMMSNVPNATVTSYERNRGKVYVDLKIPGKKNMIQKVFTTEKRVWVNEYPESNRLRKELSRMPANRRYDSVTRTIDAD